LVFETIRYSFDLTNTYIFFSLAIGDKKPAAEGDNRRHAVPRVGNQHDAGHAETVTADRRRGQ
jgi:hypothetical protein